MADGLFVSFEGSEGCGKSTQMDLLKRRLEEAGREVLVTREPGGTAAGEEIRRLLQFAPEGQSLVPEAELLLFAASRAQLVRERLRPALEAGQVVLADRFLDSTTVYQGLARGLGVEAVGRINAFAVEDCLPARTVLLDMDSAHAHARAAESTRAASGEGAVDRMEAQPLEFFEAVRRGYLEVAAAEPDRFLVIDATMSVEAVAEEIWNTLKGQFDGLLG